MIHPLIQLLATRPELVAEHVGSYGDLVAAQASQAASQLRRRAWLAGGVLVGLSAAVGLGGVALLLLATLPLAQMPMPALLWVVPLVPLLVAAGCAWALNQRPMAWGLGLLGEQLAADAALLRAVTPE